MTLGGNELKDGKDERHFNVPIPHVAIIGLSRSISCFLIICRSSGILLIVWNGRPSSFVMNFLKFILMEPEMCPPGIPEISL